MVLSPIHPSRTVPPAVHMDEAVGISDEEANAHVDLARLEAGLSGTLRSIRGIVESL